MKRFYALVLMSVMAVLMGCQNNKKQELAEVPPPPAYTEDSFEPVQVQEPAPAPQPVPAAPVYQQPAPAPAPAPQPAGQRTYVVRKGDTLWSIASRQYGDGQKWVDILNANPGLVPEKMREGQTIVLP